MPHRLVPIARKLRRGATRAERSLWSGIRREQIEGFKFRRQVVLFGFIADFACYEARLVLEVDGATHSTEKEIENDNARSAVLQDEGFAVLRFTNEDVYRNLAGVLETIRLKLRALRPRLDEADFSGRRDPPP
jgi:very-short-patch-repair endonuclease